MNFGTIKNTFTQILIESHINNDKKGKDLYKKFLKILKENETLRTYYIAYKNIEDKTVKSEVEANEYLKENLNAMDKYRGRKNVINESKLLISLIENSGFKTKLKSTPLHESLHHLTTTTKDVGNLNDMHESFGVVKEWLQTEKTVNEGHTKPTVDANKFLDIAVSKYNEKYSTISEQDKKILKVIMSTNDSDKVTLLNDLKNETIELINTVIKEFGSNLEVKVKLLESKDVIRCLEYNKETFKEDVLKVYDLMKSLT